MIASQLFPVSFLSLESGYIIFAVLVSGFIAFGIGFRCASRYRVAPELQENEHSGFTEFHLNTLLQAQAEMQGRIQAMAEMFGTQQSEMNRLIRDNLDNMSTHIGQTIRDQTRSTHENLSRLQERLAVIDRAQNNIQSLAGKVVELQSILSNKQTRGAFGQGRMEAIISDSLPASAYAFQVTLSNGTRPDCIIYMPGGMPSLVIDAKFPLEAWNAMRHADNPQMHREAESRFRRDMEVHIRDIAQKYLIVGETQDTAFLFVPFESVFAMIYEKFEALVQKANRLRVIIVSPSLLMLSVQVVQSILKDARMREQAHLIQSEVGKLAEDVERLGNRVLNLKKHFHQAESDVNEILTSASKVTRRGDRIKAFELGIAKDSEMQQYTPHPASTYFSEND